MGKACRLEALFVYYVFFLLNEQILYVHRARQTITIYIRNGMPLMAWSIRCAIDMLYDMEGHYSCGEHSLYDMHDLQQYTLTDTRGRQQ